MYSTTRKFISERSRHSKFSLQEVKVRRNPIFDQQNCLQNANRAALLDVLNSGSKQNPVVAGWLIHKFNPLLNNTEIVQHWWNYDPVANVYFDTTPFSNDIEIRGFEYLIDEEILHIATTQLQRLEHTVGRDLIFTNDQWHVIEKIIDSDRADTKLLEGLSIENLMYFKKF